MQASENDLTDMVKNIKFLWIKYMYNIYLFITIIIIYWIYIISKHIL